MAKKEKSSIEFFTTPPGIASMVFLNEPSTKFDPDGVYSVKLAFEPDDMAEHIERFEKAIETKLEETLKEKPKYKKIIKKVSPFSPELDDEGNETGKIVFNFKRKHKQKINSGEDAGKTKINKVHLIDVEGNPIEDSVWSGSTIAARYFMTPYFSEKDKEVGVSLKLTHAMVIDIVNGGDGDGPQNVDKLGFGKHEGYRAGKKTAKSTDDDEDDQTDDETSSDDEDDADF